MRLLPGAEAYCKDAGVLLMRRDTGVRGVQRSMADLSPLDVSISAPRGVQMQLLGLFAVLHHRSARVKRPTRLPSQPTCAAHRLTAQAHHPAPVALGTTSLLTLFTAFLTHSAHLKKCRLMR